MTDILVHPQELRQISEQLRLSAKKVGVALQAIDNDILSLKGDKFLGNRADTVQAHYAPKREALLQAQNIVIHFADDLQNAATVFENADRGQFAEIPFSGGVGGVNIFPRVIPQWLDKMPKIVYPWENIDKLKLPAWLRSALDQVFKPAQIVSPIAEGQPTSGFGELLKQSPIVTKVPETPVAIIPDADQKTVLQNPVDMGISSRKTIDVSYDVPIQSQGSVYHNAGCTPTSISMVLAYYNAQNPANKLASAQQIVDISDANDRLSTKGMALTDLTDELNTLGYKNVNVQVNAQYSDLQTAIKDGPVIVTTGVNLTGDGIINSSGPRTLVGPGNIIHAMVVTGIGNDQVVVNDPWSGTQVEISKESFEKMWARGSGGMYSIKP